MCRFLYEMMQFVRGDVTQCVAAVDGFYFMYIRSEEYRLAISNYTLEIPLVGKYAAADNKNQVPEENIVNLIRKHLSYCSESTNIRNFPYSIQNDTLVVRPITEGQILKLSSTYQVLIRNYEVAFHEANDYKICYPSNIMVDYIDIQPYNSQGGLH